jgi:hypothetical protein
MTSHLNHYLTLFGIEDLNWKSYGELQYFGEHRFPKTATLRQNLMEHHKVS